MVNRIRKFDTSTLIFYEPLAFGVFFPDSKLDTGTGFDRVPGLLTDPNAAQKSVLSYHGFCWILQSTTDSESMTWWSKIACDYILTPLVFKNTQNSIQRTGGGRFLTSFSQCDQDGQWNSLNRTECDTVLNKADEQFQSWTYWGGNLLDSSGNPIANQIKFLVRPYPMATRGSPINLSFNPETGEFRYEFSLNTSGLWANDSVAVIFLPLKEHYAAGAFVRISPQLIKFVLERNRLRLWTSLGGLIGQVNVTVTITRGCPPTNQSTTLSPLSSTASSPSSTLSPSFSTPTSTSSPNPCK
ncbi:unnamed protein product [Echinostoma caproni]|uniref:Glycoside hydrolase family 5 C-terminal domain-containing protein n=1 Tax=Echinostoma caproni TaxID=27848 RepID=A0A3P8I7S7_9TREM|nr:unnamed protein product [Echinostoma caproni]